MFHRLQLLTTSQGGVAYLMASDHRALAKGDEATHLPRSCATNGTRKLLAPLSRVRVMLSSVSVSQEKGITRAKQGKRAA